MAVVMRLRRMGAKKDPKFRIVVAESRYQRDGRFVEELGHYNPQPKDAELRIDAERAAYWLSVGATPSDQVKSLLKQAGIAVPVKANKPKATKEKAAKGATKKNVGARKRAVAKKARAAAKEARPKKPAKKPAGKKAAKK